MQSPALDLTSIVNSTGERLLLGTAISQVKQTGENEKYDNDLKIYLIFTRSVNDTDVNNTNCTLEKCETNNSVANRLYQYKFRDGQLVNPKLVLDVPLYNYESIQHIGGAVTVDPKEYKIFFTTGDGRGCEYDEDCNSKMASIRESVEPVGSGGIFF